MNYLRNGKSIGSMEGDVFRKKIVEAKHLLWSKGGVPCIDADTWDGIADKVTSIEISTDKGRVFKVLASVFTNAKKELDLGYGRQYYLEKFQWVITDPKDKPKDPTLF